MPIIDVYAPEDMFADGMDRILAERLTAAVIRAEGAPVPTPDAWLELTGAYIHRLPNNAVHTAGTGCARTVRIQLTVGSGAIKSEAQKHLVAEATQIIADVTGDPDQAARTWVVIVEAMKGWGQGGRVLGKEDAARFFPQGRADQPA